MGHEKLCVFDIAPACAAKSFSGPGEKPTPADDQFAIDFAMQLIAIGFKKTHRQTCNEGMI